MTCDDQELLDGVVRPLLGKIVALDAGSSVRRDGILIIRGGHCDGYSVVEVHWV